MSDVNAYHLFHSFPRPRPGEAADVTFDRGLKVLESMRAIGLVLAPEVVEWDVALLSGGQEELRLLQRRACFTQIRESELAEHSKTFGPISLSFDTEKLRLAGAMPVIYVPQGIGDNPLSLISTFCVRGAYHTHYVLRQLDGLKQASDPAVASAQAGGLPVHPDYTLTLQNTDPTGALINLNVVKAADVKGILDHVGYRNIPFDQSAGVLSVFMNIFCPTDNTHSQTPLGYYQQREWRLFGGDVNMNGRPIARPFTVDERRRIEAVDPQFWGRELVLEKGERRSRLDLGLIYEPIPGWNLFDLVESIRVPTGAVQRVRELLGTSIAIDPMAD